MSEKANSQRSRVAATRPGLLPRQSLEVTSELVKLILRPQRSQKKKKKQEDHRQPQATRASRQAGKKCIPNRREKDHTKPQGRVQTQTHQLSANEHFRKARTEVQMHDRSPAKHENPVTTQFLAVEAHLSSWLPRTSQHVAQKKKAQGRTT